MAARSTVALIAWALATFAGAGLSRAHPGEDGNATGAAPLYEGNGVTVDEKLGTTLPLDAFLMDQDGHMVRLADVLAGDTPTILTFNYADCPMLCSQQLNGLTASLPALTKGDDTKPAMKLGAHFRVVTISLEPNENLTKLSKMREKYLERLVQLGASNRDARAGWTFLTTDPLTVKRIADAVGFKYVYIQDRAEWAHPAALIMLGSHGVVTRYLYGIEFPPDALRESIWKAGTAEPSTSVGFMFRCYHYDPDAKDHSRAGVLALRIGAGTFVVLLGFGIFVFARRYGRRELPMERT
jgi:protein SCO1